MWEEIQVLQLFPDPCASAQRYLTPAQIFGNPGVNVLARGLIFGKVLKIALLLLRSSVMLLAGGPLTG